MSYCCSSVNKIVRGEMIWLREGRIDMDKNRYMGDRWVSTNLMTSTYVWLPLTISGTTATLVCPFTQPSLKQRIMLT